MIKDEIKNEIQLGTINVSKTIAYKSKGTESKKNEEKDFQVTSHRTTIHAPHPIEEEDLERIKWCGRITDTTVETSHTQCQKAT